MAPRRKFIIEVGQVFGRLTVIKEEFLEKDPNHHYYLCHCVCGNNKIVRDRCLYSGETQSCGCLWKETMKDLKNKQSKEAAIPIGSKFGYLEVLEDLGIQFYGTKNKKEHLYRCKCVCGKELIIRQYCLKGNTTTSCGCHKHDNSSKVLSEKARKKREYPDWLSSLVVYNEEKEGIKNKIYTYEDKLHFKCTGCGVTVEKPITYVMRLNKEREDPIVLCLNCSDHRSSFEEEVSQFLFSLISPDKVKRNIWGVLRDGRVQYELDFYIPSLNLAIECNGDYYHSEQHDKSPKYHQTKFRLAEEKGIHLIQIFESSWKNNNIKIKKYLVDLFSDTIKVYARKCLLKSVDKSLVESFYNENHLQGYISTCNISYALFYEDEIVAAMSFSKTSLHNPTCMSNSYYELVRYAVKFGYSVIGGCSRLLHKFEQEYYPSKMLSYSDNDFFTGNMYLKLGFLMQEYTRPRYHWFMKNQTVKTREQCQLKYLSKEYPELYVKSLSYSGNKEDYIMTSLKAVKVWHSGNKRWVKLYDTSEEKKEFLVSNDLRVVEDLNSSSIKNEIKSFLEVLHIDIVYDIVADFYIPNAKLAIKISKVVLKQNKNYHKDLFNDCVLQGIHLITIFEQDWIKSKDKILDLIKFIILPTRKVYARQCDIKYISEIKARDFYDTYHIQNSTPHAKINLGLYYKGELLSVMGFGSSAYHNRRNNDGDYELHRFVTKSDCTVVGGASKLLHRFEQDYQPRFLLSYSWNDWFTGDLYYKLGFIFNGKIPPDYYWYYKGECINKRKCRLKNLQVQYPSLFQEALDNNASNKEDYVMEKLGAVKVYRSGSKRWEKIYVR